MRILLPALAFAASALAQEPGAAARGAGAADSTAQSATGGAPVLLAGDTLFRLRAPFGQFSAEARADAVTARLKALTRAGVGPVDTVVAAQKQSSTELLLRDSVIMSVLEADTAGTGQAREELAREWAHLLTVRLENARLAAAPRALLLDTALVLLSTAVLAVLLWLLSRGFPRLYTAAGRVRELHKRFSTVKVVRLISPDATAGALVNVLRLLRAVVTILLFYFYVPLVLSFFPWTKPFSQRIVGYAVTPFLNAWSGFTTFLPNVFTIAAIIVITVYVLKFVRIFFDAIGRGSITFEGFHRDWARPTYKMVRLLVIAFAAVVVFPYLPGSQSEAFKGVSIFLGVLFSFGSSSAIGNAVAGVVLTYTRSFQIGDRVKVGETVGDVTEKTLLVTRIRTIKNVDVTIPNGVVLGGQVVNYTSLASTRGLILHTTATIGYDAPWRQVHELMIAAALATKQIKPDPAPFVLQTSLDDFYVSYQVNAYTDRADLMASIYSDLHQNIQDRFNAAGVEILSPHFRQLRDGNQVTIPPDQLPKDYKAPTFVVTLAGGAGPAGGAAAPPTAP